MVSEHEMLNSNKSLSELLAKSAVSWLVGKQKYVSNKLEQDPTHQYSQGQSFTVEHGNAAADNSLDDIVRLRWPAFTRQLERITFM